MKFSVFQISRRGDREKNEDRMGYCYTREAGLFLLADGMGGHPEGEVAAQMALQALSAMFQRAARPIINDPAGFLSDAILAAHRQILRYALDRAMDDTPRTTIVAALLQGNTAYWAHCGDSRLYQVRGGQLVTRTRDHSYMEQRLTLAADAKPSAYQNNRNVLFTCLGSPTKPQIDIKGPVELEHGDRLLLCSDGLWGSVDDDVIVHHVGSKPVPTSAPDLVEVALQNAKGTSDNVTVLAIEWESQTEFMPTKTNISTDEIADGGFASTLQVPLGPELAAMDDLDEAAIERSIAEINEAIKRSAARKR